MYVVVWQFRVRPEWVPEFERAYGAEGDWAQLFTRSPGFIRTDLWREPGEIGNYFTADYWRDPPARDSVFIALRKFPDRTWAFRIWLRFGPLRPAKARLPRKPPLENERDMANLPPPWCPPKWP